MVAVGAASMAMLMVAVPLLPAGKERADDDTRRAAVTRPRASVLALPAPTATVRDIRPDRGLARPAAAPRPPKPTPPPLPSCQPRELHLANGEIPRSMLCHLPGTDHYLAPRAAIAFWQLSTAFKLRFGERLCITDSYRSRAMQQAAYERKPGLVAPPGTSNHGWGTAVDLCGGVQDFGSAQHEWLVEHAPAFGWINPRWARENGRKPEPWHWEFVR